MKVFLKEVNVHLPALVVLVGGLTLHFWYIFLNLTTALYAGPGDHTAGIIWLYEQNPSSPWWSFTTNSAYPFGDSLWNPTFILGQVYYILFWLFSSIFSSGVAGYNLMAIFGLSLGFLAVYAFAVRIIKILPWYAAALSYVAVFNPFLFALIGVGHLSYVFAPVYTIAVCYLLYRVYVKREKKLRFGALLGLVVGGTWLVDPYFVLFVALLATGFVVAVAMHGYYTNRRIHISTPTLRNTLTALFITLCMIAPLILFSVMNNSSLKKNTYDVRSDIRTDVGLYSARVKDFLLPSVSSPLVPDLIKQYKSKTFHGTNPTFTTYIGWSVIVFGVVGAFLVGLLTAKRKIKIPAHLKVLGAGLLGGAVMLLLFSFPPTLNVGGFMVPTPTEALISTIGVWRVLARSYIFIFILILLSLAILIKILESGYGGTGRTRLRMLLIVFCILLPFDFLARNPFDQGQYFKIDRDMPTTYEQVKGRQINALAEYPLREAPHYRGSLYFTAQLYHEKKIFNSIVTVNDQTLVRESLMDLNNPQTLRSLRFLGVDMIHVWSNWVQQWSPQENTPITLLAQDNYKSMFGPDDVKLYSLDEVPVAAKDRYIVVPNWDARMTNGEYLSEVEQNIHKDASLSLVDICDVKRVDNCNTYRNLGPERRFDVFASFVNKSSEVRSIEIRHRNTVQKYSITPGERVNLRLATDVKLDDKIAISLNETEKVFIYGYHSDFSKQE